MALISHCPPQHCLQAARQYQQTSEFEQRYANEGVEGTLSRVRAHPTSRHIGLAKTQLQHLATATAMT